MAPGGTDLGADTAFALGKLAAELRIYLRLFRDGLRERDVDGPCRRNAEVEVIISVLGGTFFHADAAARALRPVHVCGLSF